VFFSVILHLKIWKTGTNPAYTWQQTWKRIQKSTFDRRRHGNVRAQACRIHSRWWAEKNCIGWRAAVVETRETAAVGGWVAGRGQNGKAPHDTRSSSPLHAYRRRSALYEISCVTPHDANKPEVQTC